MTAALPRPDGHAGGQCHHDQEPQFRLAGADALGVGDIRQHRRQQQQQQPVHECDQGDADGVRAAVGASTAELHDQLPRHHIRATRRICAYRLGCVAEVTAFPTANLTRFGLPARIRP